MEICPEVNNICWDIFDGHTEEQVPTDCGVVRSLLFVFSKGLWDSRQTKSDQQLEKGEWSLKTNDVQ